MEFNVLIRILCSDLQAIAALQQNQIRRGTGLVAQTLRGSAAAESFSVFANMAASRRGDQALNRHIWGTRLLPIFNA
jgi:hypothetical protein